MEAVAEPASQRSNKEISRSGNQKCSPSLLRFHYIAATSTWSELDDLDSERWHSFIAVDWVEMTPRYGRAHGSFLPSVSHHVYRAKSLMTWSTMHGALLFCESVAPVLRNSGQKSTYGHV